MTLSTRAELFAKSIHAHQVDKAGKPYSEHLQSVVNNLVEPSEEMVAVAWLHDSVEDTESTFDDLTHYFGNTVSEAVCAITNMDLSRLPVVTERDLARKEKYLKAKEFLEN